MINIQKGLKDVLPAEAYKWHYVEGKARAAAAAFCFTEIRTPTFEATELFQRGVGETTDIVNKEMYTFLDKGERSITLKPEGTAGVARSFIENSLAMDRLPLKMYYITPVFRYERPQSGRLREHHQFGVELYGADTPESDAEVISIAKYLLDSLGIGNLELNINSIGCPECRARYNAALKKYLTTNIDKMCDLCKDRLNKNPLRILDCKNEECIKVNADATVIQDYLCDDCKAHQAGLMSALDILGITYKINPRIVRGLDYYTRTVFEFISKNIGAQGTVCGGGRYNNLVEEVGGKPCPAVGFGMGLERLIMVMEALGLPFGSEPRTEVYIAPMSDSERSIAINIASKLRGEGISVEFDIMGRGLKSQLKYANKVSAKYLLVIGEQERLSGEFKLKDMDLGAEETITVNAIGAYVKARRL